MRLRDRIVLIALIAAATTMLEERGAFRGLDVPLHDASLALLDRIPNPFVDAALGNERCRVIAIDPRDANSGFTLDEVTDVLERLGKRANATAWIALPPGLAFDDVKRVERLAKAFHLLGRVGLAWRDGTAGNDRAGLDRIGDDAGLPPASGFDPVPATLENAIEFVTRDHLESNAERLVRSLDLGERDGERVIPTPPLAIAASALHESSLALSQDALTIESFGGRDHRLAAESVLRLRPISRAHPLLTLEEALALPVEKSNPPILLIGFQGAPVLESIDLPFQEPRSMLRVIADVTEDLLRARIPYRAEWFTTLAFVALSAILGAFAADTQRRFASLLVGTVGSASIALFVLASSSCLPPLAAMLGAGLLGFAVAGKR